MVEIRSPVLGIMAPARTTIGGGEDVYWDRVFQRDALKVVTGRTLTLLSADQWSHARAVRTQIESPQGVVSASMRPTLIAHWD